MNTSDSRPRTPWPVHVLCYALLGCLLAYVLVSRYLRPLVFSETIGVEPARIDQVEQRIDPNVATWPELARLPGIGEAVAKRIIDYRQEHRPPSGGPPVFRSPHDLTAINGIGPKTLEKITPHLKFPPQ